MSIKVIATNRKARHEYHILEKYEGGIVLHGSEVKAIREGKANIKEAYVRFSGNELFVIGMHIGKYSNEGYSTHTPVRNRKLLLHRRELSKMRKMVEEKGATCCCAVDGLAGGVIDGGSISNAGTGYGASISGTLADSGAGAGGNINRRW